MQETNDNLIGRVVISKAGRDKGRAFVVTAEEGTEYVWLVDGGLRKLSRPKKKKRRHIAVEPERLELIRTKLLEGRPIFDAEIRNSLRKIGYITEQD